MPSDAFEPQMSPEEIEAVRVRIRATMAERKMAMTDVSRQVGIPYGTFSSWMGGTYKGRNASIAEQVMHWLNGLEAADRTRALAPRAPAFVATPTADAILATLEHAQYMPEMVVVTGAPGVGKTSSARWYAARNANVWMITAEPTMSSPRALLDELAEAIGVTERGLSSQKLSRSLGKRMTGSQGLILIDEAQHLTSQTLDQLRMFHDQAGIGIALLGNESVYARLEGGTRAAQFAQLYSRVGMRLQRPRALKGDVEKLLDAWGVAGKEERTLLQTIAKRPGALRNLTKALRMAHMLAGAEGAEAMGENHIRMAWERLSSGATLTAEAA
ncbi:AAA family ATPase [Roseomonas eburnea]|uniref:AAA family ATPase n=1 Tax=Neoroseomonas eburnea TaxID=1346889 RepID=A0A9X9XE14_9PROT|nr:AAA family ATPase [Neoroseomonas eburnea]MBR0681950.1 AAA family ATPase [Neoroseomonas eburnea]